MKKILSILGVIGLTATSTTSLISCEKPNNNENGGRNKPEPTPEHEQPQKPPVGSKWKLIDYPTSKNKLRDLFKNSDNKWYIVNLFTTQEGHIIRKFKFTNETKLVKKSDYDETAWKYKFKDYEGLPIELVGYYRYIYLCKL